MNVCLNATSRVKAKKIFAVESIECILAEIPYSNETNLEVFDKIAHETSLERKTYYWRNVPYTKLRILKYHS